MSLSALCLSSACITAAVQSASSALQLGEMVRAADGSQLGSSIMRRRDRWTIVAEACSHSGCHRGDWQIAGASRGHRAAGFYAGVLKYIY